jgi:hypothetical protein
MQQGLKYLGMGIALFTIALSLLFYVPSALQFTVQTVIGAVVLGMIFFGFIFIFVSMEEMKSHFSAEAEEKPRKKK